VRYDKLIEGARATVELRHRRGAFDRLLRSAVFAVIPHRRRLRAALALRRLPAPGRLGRLRALAPSWSSTDWPPEHLPGEGKRVALLAGCVQSVVFGDVNMATARVLQAHGYDVHVPRAQGCCGALHAHAGRLQHGVAAAHALAEQLSGYDHIVTNAAGCGSHLKDHGIDGVVDVSELLATATSAERHPLAIKVAFQDSCHLRHAQRIVSQPREMLDSIPGLERLEPAEQDLCCGSAGIYNLVQPQAAAELGDRKARSVLATGAVAYASANPGCLVQVSAALRRLGSPLPAFHPVELLDASIRGVDPDQLLEEARR
jgi:glycolate oxidase iron-sulfur subunit